MANPPQNLVTANVSVFIVSFMPRFAGPANTYFSCQ
jgi:hypothetical protein